MEELIGGHLVQILLVLYVVDSLQANSSVKRLAKNIFFPSLEQSLELQTCQIMAEKKRRQPNTDCQDFCLSRKMTVKKCPFFAVIHEFFHQKFIHAFVHSSIHPFVYLYILTIVLSISSQTVHEKKWKLILLFRTYTYPSVHWLTHFIIRSFYVSFIQLLVHSFPNFL